VIVDYASAPRGEISSAPPGCARRGVRANIDTSSSLIDGYGTPEGEVSRFGNIDMYDYHKDMLYAGGGAWKAWPSASCEYLYTNATNWQFIHSSAYGADSFYSSPGTSGGFCHG
jgi:hypothetical protein